MNGHSDKILRLERLEELAKRKRNSVQHHITKSLNENNKGSRVELADYLKSFKIPKVETSANQRSYRSSLSGETEKVNTNSYEGDKQNLWMIRVPSEEKNPTWSKENPPDPSSVFFAEYVKSQINGQYERSDSDKTPSLPGTPKCNETLFFDSEYEAQIFHNKQSNLKAEKNNNDLTQSSKDEKLPALKEKSISNALIYYETCKVITKYEIENNAEMMESSRLSVSRNDLNDAESDLLIDQTFDKETFLNGIFVIKPKVEDVLETLLSFRKLSRLELNLNIKTNNLSDEKRQYSILLDTCAILKYAGIVKRMLRLSTISIIIPDLVLKETRNLIENERISNAFILEVTDQLERFTSIKQKEEEGSISKDSELRAEYFISIAKKFPNHQIFSEDSVVNKLAKEKKIKVIDKKYIEIITRKLELCNLVPEMNDSAVFIEFKSQIRELLEAVMISEMEEFYKDQWTNIVKIKPASEGKLYWNLNSLLDLFQLHFTAIFTSYFQLNGKTLKVSLLSIRTVLKDSNKIKEKINMLIPLSFTLCHEVGWRGELPVSSWLHQSSLQIASHLKGFTEVLSSRQNREAMVDEYEIDPDQVV